MVDPRHVDAIIDIAYGALILLAIILIATLEFGIGIAFGLGVFSAYILHVIWKMGHFNSQFIVQAAEDSVSETIEKQVSEVQSHVEDVIDETVEEELEEIHAEMRAVDERIERRPREDEIEELIENSINNHAGE